MGKYLVGSSRGLIIRYCPGIHLEGQRKTTTNLNQDNRSQGPRIEPGTFRMKSKSVKHSTTTCGLIVQLGKCEVDCRYMLKLRCVLMLRISSMHLAPKCVADPQLVVFYNWPVTGVVSFVQLGKRNIFLTTFIYCVMYNKMM
jgi:hypothetical protein